MKRIGLIACLAVLAGPSTAQGSMRCYDDGLIDPANPACSRTFIAVAEPQRFIALPRQPDRKWMASSFVVNGQHFLASSRRRGCRDYGRFGDLRVREVYCDGRNVVYVRSVGVRTTVTFEWETVR